MSTIVSATSLTAEQRAVAFANGATQIVEPNAIFFSDGTALGGELQTGNSVVPGDQGEAGVTVLSSGGYVVSWRSADQEPGSGEVYFQIFDSDGVQTGSSTRVNTYTAGAQVDPSISPLTDGGFVVSWTSVYQDGSGIYGVYAQRFDAAGEKVGAEVLVPATTSGDQQYNTTVGLAGGGYAVIWASNRPGVDYNVYAQIFDSDGAKSGGEIRLNSILTGDQFDASAAALADGGFMLTWTSYGQDGAGTEVYCRHFDSTGVGLGPEVRVNSTTDGDQAKACVAALTNGDYVVVWTSYSESGDKLLSQRYNSAGDPLGGETVIADNATLVQPASVVALSDGGYAVSWSDDENPLVGGNIYTQRFSEDGTPDGPVARLNLSDSAAGNSSITGFSDGTYVVAWVDMVGGNADVLYRHISRLDYRVLTAASDSFQGSSEDTLVVTAPSHLGSGDQLAGGSGVDTIEMSSSGILNLAAANITSFERIVGASGDDTFSLGAGMAGPGISFDGRAGFDTMSYASATSGVTATLAGAVSVERLQGSAYSDNLTGSSGNDVVVGGGGNDVIFGAAGNDYLDGGVGDDDLRGGWGDDTYLIDSASDQVVELAGRGNDTVLASTSYSLGQNIENLTLTGTAVSGSGNDASNVLIGNGVNNILQGGGGNDRLDGVGGVDQMYGGVGDDIFVVDNINDGAWENPGEGIDRIEASISYRLGDNVENLTLVGSAAINGTGNELANQITGNSGANILKAGAGNDRLIGGLGGDVMYGGAGDDVFVIDETADQVRENAFEGTDLVESSVGHGLGANFENLTLTGSAAINGSGNDLANTIKGNSAANVLKGGAGNDTLIGGAGNDRLEGGIGDDTAYGGVGDDTFVIDSLGDQVRENAGEGIDLVESSVSHQLGANFEKLTLTGSAAIDGTGNDLANAIKGNSAANVLKGGAGNDTLTGGAGNDRLEGGLGVDTAYGGAGDDTFVIDSIGDQVRENAGEGIDLVESSISHQLGANFEKLTLTGSAAINAVGNELANTITGNSADNRINGMGGADVLKGGGGADTFVYKALSDSQAGAADLIQDLTSLDRIDLSAIDANDLLSGNQAFVRMDGAFTTAGQLRLVLDGGNTRLELNTDGDANAEMVILLAGNHTAATAEDGWLL